MSRFLQEYGRMIIAMIAAFAIFALIGILLGLGPTGISSLFKKYSQDSNAVYGDESTFTAVSGDVYEQGLNIPYFKISDNLETTFDTSAFTYEDAIRQVSAMYKDALVDSSNITILAYWYEPVIEKTADDANGHVVFETVNAVDKYGKYIYEDDGVTIRKTKQVKYQISDPVQLKPGTYIDTTADNAMIKLVYRVEVDSLKAECSVIYTKGQTIETVNPEGSPLVFTFSEGSE